MKNSKILLIGSLSALAVIGLFFASISISEDQPQNSFSADENLELSRGQEKNAMQELSCEELKEKYDGKIHTAMGKK